MDAIKDCRGAVENMPQEGLEGPSAGLDVWAGPHVPMSTLRTFDGLLEAAFSAGWNARGDFPQHGMYDTRQGSYLLELAHEAWRRRLSPVPIEESR